VTGEGYESVAVAVDAIEDSGEGFRGEQKMNDAQSDFTPGRVVPQVAVAGRGLKQRKRDEF
jgi:hypothetical protein